MSLKVKKVYKKISYEDRKKIEAMVKKGEMDETSMAAAIGVHFSTIRRELQRGGNPYSAEVAQRSL